jgi:hypothetical protein
MIALRLVRLIESHADVLAQELTCKLQASPRTSDMRKVPTIELRERMHEVLQHLSEWLLTRPGSEIQQRYVGIGLRRAAQGVSLSDYCWAMVMTKETLWDFVQKEGVLRGAIDLYGEIELLRLIDQFFDSALCHAADGFEQFGVTGRSGETQRSQPHARVL